MRKVMILFLSLFGILSIGSLAAQTPIAYSVMASGTYDKAALSLTDSLKQQGIDLTVAAFPWAALRQNNTTDLLTGTGKYDVMSGSYYLADVYSNFISLDDLIAKNNFGPGLLSGLMAKCERFNGHQIGLPYGSDVEGFMYRKDLFDKAGIKWPSTWAEMVKLIPQLKKLAAANGMSVMVFPGGQSDQMPALFVDKYEGYFINKNKKFQLQADKAVAALNIAKSEASLMDPAWLGLSFDDAHAQFLSGKALISYDWPSFVLDSVDVPAKSAVAGKWALGKTPTPGRPWLSLWQMYISKYSKNPEAAFKFAMAMLNATNDKAFFLNYGIGPSFAATYKDPEVVKAHTNYFDAQQYNLSVAVNPSMSGEAQDYFSSSLGEFFLGKITAQEFVAKVNAKWATLTVPAAMFETAAATGQMEK